ncbi:hypothetical protein [Marinivivus vitaminiproducens]|uniref:hypothetical protein n=1 Tax=Marinivivus vitaminiproducens TaxID=3035935 RepID=UPI00279E23D9|nr:hypothetical protein P4R82_04995 [Geminicoccaceae bacterium SCSIO 64248]
MIPSQAEIRSSLQGAFRLARFDEGGVHDFNLSLPGFWQSFFAAVLVAPGYVLLVAQKAANEPEPIDLGLFGLVELVGFVLSWIVFPLAAIPLTRLLGLDHRYAVLIIASNWAKVVQMIAFLASLLVAAILPPEGGAPVILIVTVAILVYQWFIARVTLDTSASIAAGVVAVDLLLGIFVSGLIESAF